jgi:hypothetical protein
VAFRSGLTVADNIFYTDDDVNGIAIRMARKRGVQIVTSAEAGLGGADDADHFAHAVEQGYVLMTANIQDFAPLFAGWLADGNSHPGIVFITGLNNQRPALLAAALDALRDWDMANRLEFI